MARYEMAAARAAGFLRAASAALLLALGQQALAEDQGPIRIGVIAEAQAVAGSSIPRPRKSPPTRSTPRAASTGARSRSSPTTIIRLRPNWCSAFQRAVNEDHVNAVIGSYISEVVLALEPWAGRLKTVFITPGAASDVITAEHRQGLRAQQIHLPRLPDLRRALGARLRRRQGHAGRRPQDEDRGDHERGRRLDDAARRRLRGMPAEDRASRFSTTSASRRTPPISPRSSTRSRARNRT